jgi:hypothetical protein
MTSTNQTLAPQLKNLRVIALAWYGNLYCKRSQGSRKRS